MTATFDPASALTWSEPKRVETQRGPRTLRIAPATEDFWAAWKQNKPALAAAGLRVRRDGRTGQWSVCWWQPLDGGTKAKETAAVQASRANDADVAIPCPPGLAYLPYQKAGIAFCRGRAGTLLADEMGLGKTIQAIGAINDDPTIVRVLVIAPATLKINWARELSKWLVRKLSVGIADSKVWPSTDIVIVNYDVLTKWPKKLEFYWDLVVIDEAQYIKNPRSIRTKAVIGNRSKKDGEVTSGIPAKRKIALTGTPILNRPIEAWPILTWLAPREWPSMWQYARRYCNAHNNGWGWDLSGASNLEELQHRLRTTVMIRRLKADVLTDLPPKRRQVIELPADGTADLVARQNREWDAGEAAIIALRSAVELAKVSDDQEGYKQAVQALRDGMRARFEAGAKIAHEVALAKVPYVIEHVRDLVEAGTKVLLFAHHLDVIAAYHAAFLNSVVVTGEVGYAERQEAVDRFQKDPTANPFIGGIHAAGVGLTLTASSHVVFAELDWVPGNLSQAEDRAHRIRQRESVLVQHLVLEGSLDARMAKTLIDKQDVIDRALDRKTARQEEMSEPLVPMPVVTITREEIERATQTVDDEQGRAVHRCLQILAGVCDGAVARDNCGFNGCDAHIGHSLAAAPRLSPKQAALGAKIITKYKRQLPADLYETALRRLP